MGTSAGRVLFIGQAPSRRTDGMPAFSGDCGRRLAALAGVPDFRAAFDAVNAVDRWAGKDGRGDAFDAAEARRNLAALDLSGYGRVVFVGAKAAGAAGFAAPPLAWAAWRRVRAALVPHPSGLCRWWNEASNREAARAFMRRLVSEPGSRP